MKPATWIALALVLAVLLAARRHRPEDAPYVPHDDGEVLEQLPAASDPSADALRALEAKLARAPEDLDLACQVADAHLQAVSTTGDPSHIAYAEAALAPFATRTPVPERIAQLRQKIANARAALAKP